MKLDSAAQVASFALPLLLLGFAAGAVRAASHRARDPRTRRLLGFAWIALLLFGAPLWLVLATVLRLV